LRQEFRRYFDTGVAHVTVPIIRSLLKSTQAEGRSYVKDELCFLLNRAPLKIPAAILRDGIRWLGYKAGTLHTKIPLFFKKRIAMNKSFWIDEHLIPFRSE